VARRFGVQPGGTLRLRALTQRQLDRLLAGEQVTAAGPRFSLRVVAVQRLPADLSLTTSSEGGLVLLTPAFYRAYRDQVAHFPAEPHVRLRGGQADLAGFTAAARRLAGNWPEVNTTPLATFTTGVEQVTRTEAVALVLFAALAALAALVVVGQTLARELLLAAADHDTLQALGLSRPQRFAVTMLPVGLVGAAGGLVGAGLAILASPLTPIGVARRAEPDPGLVLHLAGVGAGIAATLVLVLAWAAVPAWRLARGRVEAPGAAGRAGGASSALAAGAARAGLPPTSVAGLRMALEQGQGPTSVPVRATLAGVAAGILALAAALTFTASLDRLLGTPSLYGWNFDAIVGSWELPDPASRQPPELTANPNVGAFSAVYFYPAVVDGAEVTVAGVDTAHGRVFPTTVAGREPSGPDEIALGTRTLRRLGRDVGQTVRVTAGGWSPCASSAARPSWPATRTTPPPVPS
jgi:ABC-type lipoprotein release transport system permease subunit